MWWRHVAMNLLWDSQSLRNQREIERHGIPLMLGRRWRCWDAARYSKILGKIYDGTSNEETHGESKTAITKATLKEPAPHLLLGPQHGRYPAHRRIGSMLRQKSETINSVIKNKLTSRDRETLNVLIKQTPRIATAAPTREWGLTDCHWKESQNWKGK